MKKAFIEKVTRDDGKLSGYLVDERGGTIIGGPLEKVREYVRKFGYFVEREYEAKDRPDFPKPDKAADTARPEQLSKRGRQAYAVVMRVLKRFGATDTGGCKAFYSPKEWKARGESYGLESELIVVYDGGDHRGAFEPEAEHEDSMHNAMDAALKEVGLYFEPCTGWYSAIYEMAKA